jgi:hypothetical protein
MFFDDPQPARNFLGRKLRQYASDGSLSVGMRLAVQTKHDDSLELGGWISDDIREIEIEGNEGPVLALADIEHVLIRLTAQRLRNN